MMLIVLDRDPVEAVNKLVATTPKTFYFKQLIELGQLMCSAGISSEYKTVSRGKEIQDWIRRNPLWIYGYYNQLRRVCKNTINIKEHTNQSLQSIGRSLNDVLHGTSSTFEDTTTAVFRYQKEYNSSIPTNTELPIDAVTKLYYNYIQWKLERFKERKRCFAKSAK